MTDTDAKQNAIEVLLSGGIANPARLLKLIQDMISFFELNLSGLTVLTEAASGAYVVTPVIASLAGAKRVLALTSDSSYATSEAVIAQTRALEVLCNVEVRVEIHTQRLLELFASADIVTNLGFVRPIDAETVGVMKPTAVIPLMCEAWEFREGDVDLNASREKGIPVMGTNEDYPGLDVLDYVGWLCMKMLFEAQIEIYKNTILIVSSDSFGSVIENTLTQSGLDVRLVPTLSGILKQELAVIDVIVVCDYTRRDMIIGRGGDMESEELAQIVPSVTIIQFAGRIDVAGLKKNGFFVYPGNELAPQRMAMTLAALGPRPVVELHSAGLKVGQSLAQARLYKRLGFNESLKYALAHSPSQLVPAG